MTRFPWRRRPVAPPPPHMNSHTGTAQDHSHAVLQGRYWPTTTEPPRLPAGEAALAAEPAPQLDIFDALTTRPPGATRDHPHPQRPLTGVLTMPNDDYAAARRIYDEVKRDGRRVLTLPEIQRVIDAHTAATAADTPDTPTEPVCPRCGLGPEVHGLAGDGTNDSCPPVCTTCKDSRQVILPTPRPGWDMSYGDCPDCTEETS